MVAIVAKKAANASGLFILHIQCLTFAHERGNSYTSIDSGAAIKTANRQGSTITGSLLSASSFELIEMAC
jgi:hypothetical protein